MQLGNKNNHEKVTKCHTKTLQSVFSRVHLVSVDATAKQKNNSSSASVTVKKSREKAAQKLKTRKMDLHTISKMENRYKYSFLLLPLKKSFPTKQAAVPIIIDTRKCVLNRKWKNLSQQVVVCVVVP